MIRPIVIWGAGGHAKVVASALNGTPIAGHVAQQSFGDTDLLGPFLGDESCLSELAATHDVAIGFGFVDADGATRRAAALTATGAWSLAIVVSPHAHVDPTAQLEPGAVVAPGAIIGPEARIGRAAIINSGTIVEHDVVVGANSHVASGAVIAGGVIVGNNVLIGARATVRQRITVADNAVVGAGAVVVDDVAPGDTVVGMPARSLR